MTFKTKRWLLTLLPPIIVIISVLLRKYIFSLSNLLPKCIFHALTGYLCPGCGNTRAIKEMLSLHFLTALRYNITIPIFCIFAVLWYAETVISIWIKPVRFMPRNFKFYIVIGIILFIYYIIRNFINFMPQ